MFLARPLAAVIALTVSLTLAVPLAREAGKISERATCENPLKRKAWYAELIPFHRKVVGL
jgi:hypothetical protein